MRQSNRASLLTTSLAFAFALGIASFSGCSGSDLPVEPETHEPLAVIDKAAPASNASSPHGPESTFYGVKPADIDSAYDLVRLLSLDPEHIPATVERLGFSYGAGAPTGAWESTSADTPLSPPGSTTRILFSLNGGETTSDLMRAGKRPGAITMSITAPYAEPPEAEAVGDALLQAAGLADEAYRNATASEKFDMSSTVRIGRCPEGSAAAIWQLATFNDRNEVFENTTYSLTVLTEEGALAYESDDMVEARAALGL